MGTPLSFGLVANTLQEHRWFFNCKCTQRFGIIPTIMPDASHFLNMTVCRYFPATQSFLSVSFFDRPEFSRSHPIMCFKNRIEMASVGKAKGF